jgi:hypothetical protein
MEIPDFTIKQNDRLPAFDIVVMTGLKEVVDLTDFSTPTFHMWNKRTRATVVDAAAAIVSAAGGLVRYSWGASDTVTPGLYEAEFGLLYTGALPMTIPNDGYYLVLITPEIS